MREKADTREISKLRMRVAANKFYKGRDGFVQVSELVNERALGLGRLFTKVSRSQPERSVTGRGIGTRQQVALK